MSSNDRRSCLSFYCSTGRLQGLQWLTGSSFHKDTIIVGHTLRSDLEALRMIHGRAVDMAKIVQKAANGP
jgi:hypothetical protein